MVKKDVTYLDFNGDQVTDTLWFHLSKADIIQMNVEGGPGFEDYLKRITETEDGTEIWKLFTKMLQLSYGKKSPDGRRFIKTDELFAEFKSSEAYSTLIMELMTDPDGAAEFLNGMLPENLDQDIAALTARNGAPPQAAPEVTEEPRRLTREELRDMNQDELKSGLATGRYVIAE